MVIYLERNIRTNKLNNVISYNLAVSDRVGSAKFLLNPTYHQENQLFFDHLDAKQLIPYELEKYVEVEVPTITLQTIMDRNNIERIDFLKMDCQGAEGPILHSTPKEYLRRVSKVAMEFHDHISPFKHSDLQKMLEEAGFITKLKWERKSSPLGLLYGWRA